MTSLWRKSKNQDQDQKRTSAITQGRQEDREAIATLKKQQEEEYKQNWILFQERADKLEKEMQDEIIKNNKKKQEQLERLSRKREEFKTKGRQQNFDFEFNKNAAIEIRKKVQETIDSYFLVDVYSEIRRRKDINRNNEYLDKIIPLPKIGSETIPSPKQIKDRLISYYKLVEREILSRNPDDSFDESYGNLYRHNSYGERTGRLPEGISEVYNFKTSAIPPGEYPLQRYGGNTRRSKTRRSKTRRSNTRRSNTRRSNTRRSKTRRSNTRRSKTIRI